MHRSTKFKFSTVSLLINEGLFSKASAPPLFLKDENIFLQKIGLRGTNSTAIPHCTTEANF